MSEDIVTKEEHGQTVDEHPAFGMVNLSRVQTNGMFLAGSSILHGNVISLEIKDAQRIHSYGGRSWWFGRKSLIKIYLSPTQFSELLTSMNVGDGVPCTITRFNGEGRPAITFLPTPVTEAIKHMEGKLKGVLGKARMLVKTVQKVCAETAGIKKADKETLRSLTIDLENEVGSNIPFAATCFAETMEETVKEAKGAVEEFVQSRIVSAGLEAIAQKNAPIQITHIQDNVTIDVEVDHV